jgi:hypothetical protein
MRSVYSRIGVFFLAPIALFCLFMILRVENVMLSKLFSGLSLFSVLGLLAAISMKEKA